MESDFKKWLEQKNAGWYLLPNKQFEWYLNEFLNEIEDKRKEQEENEMV